MYVWISNSVAFILLLRLTLKILKNRNDGLLFYWASSLVGPYISIGASKIKYEIVAFLTVFAINIIEGRHATIQIIKGRKERGNEFLVIWFLIFIFSTIFSLATSVECELLPARILGLFRFIYNIFLLEHIIKNRNEFFQTGKTIYKLFIIVNLPILISQYMLPNSLQFYNTLFGVSNSAPYANEIRVGFYTRGYGTSYSPTGLGMICAFIVAFFVLKYNFNKEKDDIIFLALAIIEGTLSGSKMFAFSIVILVVMSLTILPVFNGGRGAFNNMKLILGGAIFLGLSMFMLMQFNQLDRLLNYFYNPMKQFESRYGSTGSIGSADMTVLTDRLFLGYGATKRGSELIGDSMYYVLFHDIGIVGTLWYFCHLFINLLSGIRRKDFLSIVYFVLIVGMGLGDPLYFSIHALIPTFCLLYIDGNEKLR